MVLKNGGSELGIDFDVRVVEPGLAKGGGGRHQLRREVAGGGADGLQPLQLFLHGGFTDPMQPSQMPAPLSEAGNVLVVGQNPVAARPQRFSNAKENLLGMIG